MNAEISVHVMPDGVQIWRNNKPIINLHFSAAAKLAADLLQAVLLLAVWPAEEAE